MPRSSEAPAAVLPPSAAASLGPDDATFVEKRKDSSLSRDSGLSRPSSSPAVTLAGKDMATTATTSQAVSCLPDPLPPPRTHDFGIIPIPSKQRYHPDVPFKFTIILNIIFGFASTTTVANLYYCQPLLVDFTDAFHASNQAVSTIPTITQAGYAAGLLLITPLGDLVRRRPLLLAVLTCSMLLTLGVSRAPNLPTFQALSFLLGFFTVTPQILLPFAGDLAPPERRATVLSIVLSGLILGIIFARAVGGVVADVTGSWRNVYYIGVGLQAVSLILMWWVLPDWPSKVELANQSPEGKPSNHPRLTYAGIMWSMAKLAVTEPTLIQGYLIGGLCQMVFSSFWVTLTFLLAEAPYNFSTLKIGVFGLVGVGGVITAPFVGRLIDGLVLWVGVLISVGIILVSTVIMTAAGGINIGAVIVACFVLDVGLQMQQVSNTSKIFGIDPALRARLNAVYMIAGFVGQVIGSAVGSHIFLSSGWRAANGASIGFVGLMLVILLARGPHTGRYTWFGWAGGAKLSKPAASSNDVEMGRSTAHAPQPEVKAEP